MKRVLFSMVLLLATGFTFAQEKSVKEAKSIANDVKPDFAQAEKLINEALNNAETKDNAETWDVAGFIQKRINEKEPNVYNTLAMVDIARGNLDSALTHINRAIELVPKEPYFLNNRGYVLLMQNHPEEALADINESIVLDSRNAWAYRNKGLYYYMQGEYPRAVRLLEQSMGMDSFVDRIHYYLGMAYYRNGQLNKACEQFRLSEKVGDQMVPVELRKQCR